MAQMRYSDIPELKEFILNENRDFGRGAFDVVEELKMGGTLCAGKKLHPELLNMHNEKGGTQ